MNLARQLEQFANAQKWYLGIYNNWNYLITNSTFEHLWLTYEDVIKMLDEIKVLNIQILNVFNKKKRNIMKSLEEINSQIEKQADVLKKLMAKKDEIIENLSQNYIGKYAKLINSEGDFFIIKISKVFLNEVDTPYKYHGNTFKFCEGDYRFVEDMTLFKDDFDKVTPISEEEYEEYKQQFIEKLKEV